MSPASARTCRTTPRASSSADDAASIDYGSFTDGEGRDERMLVEGVRLARRVARQEPFASHLVREVFPGPAVQSVRPR